MRQELFTIIDNTPLTDTVFRLRLKGDTSEITRPGQFVNLRLDGHFLRRPISVCEAENGVLTLIVKVLGTGTEELRHYAPGRTLNILTGLGNGFDTRDAGEHSLLIGGGVGLPPMYGLAKELLRQGKRFTVVLGFNRAEDIFFEDEFRALGCEVILCTADGSRGVKGFVTDGMDRAGKYDYFFTCGPEPMLKAVYKKSGCSGQMSFEKRMGCGFGACMGCTCKTITGSKRICKDGPVMRKEEIVWEG